MVARNRKSPARRRRSPQTPVQARDVSSRGLPWGLVAVVVGVLLAVVVWVLLRSGPPAGDRPQAEAVPTSPRRAVDQLRDVVGQAETPAQIKEEELKLARLVNEAFPRDVQARILLGNVVYQHGDIPEAIAVWTEALALDPKEVKLHLRLGIAAADLGQMEQALDHWRTGLQINTNAPELRWRMATVHIELGQHQEAAALLEQECQIAPKDTRSFFLLGQTYLHLQDYARARTNYEKAIELAPDSYNAYYGLANVCLRLQERDKAQGFMQRFQELKRAEAASPEKRIKVDEVPDARERMARRYAEAAKIYQRAQQYPEQEALLKRGLELDPDNTGLLEKLGVLYFGLRRLPEALGVFEGARQIDPNNPLFYLNIGKIQLAQNRPDQVEQTLTGALVRFPDNGLVCAELAQFYLQRGQNASEALQLAHKAVAYRAAASHYFLLSWASEVNADHAGALEAIQQAMTLAPQNQKYRMLYEQIKQKL